jgi:hypothetical protein
MSTRHLHVAPILVGVEAGYLRPRSRTYPTEDPQFSTRLASRQTIFVSSMFSLNYDQISNTSFGYLIYVLFHRAIANAA